MRLGEQGKSPWTALQLVLMSKTQPSTSKRKRNPTRGGLWLKFSPLIPFQVIGLLALLLFIKTIQLLRGIVGPLARALLVARHGVPLRKIGFKKGRGRPRTTPFKEFYLRKARKNFDKIIPKRSRLRIAALSVFLLLIFYSVCVAKIASQLPSPESLITANTASTTTILDRKGRVLYQLYEGRNRQPVKLSDLPPYLIQATIAIEDKHFYTHPGIDPAGVARALQHNLSSQGVLVSDQADPLQGGSTLTQQLVKNSLLTPDKTFARKIKEAILAFWAERIYSKDQILEMYLNSSPYGGPAWGVQAAAKMYFGKDAKDLSLAESAYLAGLPAAPSEYSPYGTHPEKGRERQQEVLRRMVEDGYISQKDADKASSDQLAFQPPVTNIKAPHFVMYVRDLLAQRYGEKVVSQGGLKVVTTLDLDLQEMAENVVATEVDKLKDLKVGNGAAMITDARTGRILAMVGSKNYFDPSGGNYNVALALRQPGSSIKVVTYATAFKQGMTPGNVILDAPVTYTNPWGQGYSPVNYDGRYHGAVPIRTSLGSSYNIPAVRTLAIVGIPAMVQTAKDMGITTFNRTSEYGLSLTLGGEAVRMIEMMGVYGTLASGGVHFAPQAILTVTDSSGNVLEDHRNDPGQRVLTEEVAYLLNNVLSDNRARTPAFGANSQLYIPDHTVAVKTGTSDDKRDNWAFGYTPEYVVGAWVGNNDYSPMDPTLSSGITGATPIWRDLMDNLLRGKPDIAFKQPEGIIETTVDGNRDLGIAGQVSKTVIGYQKVSPTTGVEASNMTSANLFSVLSPSQTTQ